MRRIVEGENSFSDALLPVSVPNDDEFVAQYSSSSTSTTSSVTYRVLYTGGLPLRAGLELDSDIVYTVPKGSLLEVGDT